MKAPTKTEVEALRAKAQRAIKRADTAVDRFIEAYDKREIEVARREGRRPRVARVSSR